MCGGGGEKSDSFSPLAPHELQQNSEASCGAILRNTVSDLPRQGHAQEKKCSGWPFPSWGGLLQAGHLLPGCFTLPHQSHWGVGTAFRGTSVGHALARQRTTRRHTIGVKRWVRRLDHGVFRSSRRPRLLSPRGSSGTLESWNSSLEPWRQESSALTSRRAGVSRRRAR